jgi:apolipoprotein N-acyltransferase
VTNLATWFAGLTGWRRLVVTMLMGVTAALALPPLYLVPALVVAYTALVWTVDGLETRRQAFFIGWFFGFGYFAISLYWIGFALFVEADKYAWLLPFAAMGLPAVLAIFSGLATLVTWKIVRQFDVGGFARVLVLALSWTLFEWLRGFVFTGFPWNLPGYSWGATDATLQFASVVGVHGLGLLTIVFAASPATLADAGSSLERRAPAIASVILLVMIAGWGHMRLTQNPTTYVEGVKLRLVQPAIDQRNKWKPENRRAILEQYLQMSSAEGANNVSLLVWPETALPYFLDREPGLRRALGQALTANGLLLTGIPRTLATSRKPGTPFKAWNSVQALNANGEIVASYDKHHLVPFGEYVPLRSVLGFLGIERLAAGRGDFNRGPGPRTLDLPGYPGVSPLICYEVIFPGEVVSNAKRPGWLLNVTNDAWFGSSAGPHQHFAIARMRAVEEGLPLVRAANNGISGIIDPHGRVLRRLDLGARGILDGPLPAALIAPPVFARIGSYGLLILSVLGLVLALVLARRNRPARQES